MRPRWCSRRTAWSGRLAAGRGDVYRPAAVVAAQPGAAMTPQSALSRRQTNTSIFVQFPIWSSESPGHYFHPIERENFTIMCNVDVIGMLWQGEERQQLLLPVLFFKDNKWKIPEHGFSSAWDAQKFRNFPIMRMGAQHIFRRKLGSNLKWNRTVGWLTYKQNFFVFGFKNGVFSIQIDRVVVSFSELRSFFTTDILKMPNFQVVWSRVYKEKTLKSFDEALRTMFGRPPMTQLNCFGGQL